MQKYQQNNGSLHVFLSPIFTQSFFKYLPSHAIVITNFIHQSLEERPFLATPLESTPTNEFRSYVTLAYDPSTTMNRGYFHFSAFSCLIIYSFEHNRWLRVMEYVSVETQKLEHGPGVPRKLLFLSSSSPNLVCVKTLRIVPRYALHIIAHTILTNRFLHDLKSD